MVLPKDINYTHFLILYSSQILDNMTSETTHHWTGSDKVRKGDILLMYCGTPRSYIHSVWRAKSNGVADVFWHRGHLVEIGHPIKIPELTLKEMQKDEILSESTFVRSNMQGFSLKKIAYHEYEHILQLCKRKGMDISVLPVIKGLQDIRGFDIQNEKEVEEKLVEPLLLKLGYQESDWLRQMSVRMGRGERNYTDYSIGFDTTKGEERAEFILEAKYRITNDDDLKEAFLQANSYALRLKSKFLALAALEGIWIYLKTNKDFSLENYKRFSWKQLENPDTIYEVIDLIGKDVVLQ